MHPRESGLTSPGPPCPKAAAWRWRSPQLRSSSGSRSLPGCTRLCPCHIGNGVREKAKRTDGGAQFPPQLSRAGAVDEGGFSHSRASQENHFEHSRRPRPRARFLEVRQERAGHHLWSSQRSSWGRQRPPPETAPVLLGHSRLCRTELAPWVAPAPPMSSAVFRNKERTNQPRRRTNCTTRLQRGTQTFSVAFPGVCSYLWLSPASAKSLLESKSVHVESEAKLIGH